VSAVEKVRFDPAAREPIALTLTRVLPPVQVPPDTQWVKRIKVKSELLSKFWGRPVYLGATVLLPKGFDQEPERRYPAIYSQGHFGLGAPFGFTEHPGSETAEQREARLKRSAREPRWQFAADWMRDDFPRFVLVTWQHPTPYYDDSYAVNSANNGPYQDALLTELVPLLERQFRLAARPDARFLTGGSTGGWECLALQVQRPDFFGGSWCFCPDPVDFRRHQLVDIYSDVSAFVPNGESVPTPERYMMRTPEGQPLVTVRQMSQLEAALGSHARSGQQFDAFDAAWGPVGEDGYPKRLWDRATGLIDKSVAAYWRDQGFDLTWDLKTQWSRIGPQLTGKIHVYVGDMDNYYLNLAVYMMEEESARLENPPANFTFEYGRPMKPHGWQPFTDADLVRMVEKFRAERMQR
jgi:S-formylglutathione hydrolase FrmB